MLTRLLRVTLPALLAGTFGLEPAHADLYTWVDASGGVNVSNLAPPEGVRITNVIPASPTATHDAREAVRDAEVQALTKRVRQLEDEVGSQGSGSNGQGSEGVLGHSGRRHLVGGNHCPDRVRDARLFP